MNKTWYPLRFEPILKEKIWGGTQLKDRFNKTTANNPFGESWEIADLPQDQSVVSNGIHNGRTLGDLNNAFLPDGQPGAKAILGERVAETYGTTFPLLIKFIDASDDLSIQLHPNDEIAQQEHNCFGKTEMWYILHAEPDAKLVIGFNKPMNAKTFESGITNGTIMDDLDCISVKAGDAFFIDAGLIHAIGKGVVLAEIQQTSDVTYRVFDYNRPEADGSMRDLHIPEAMVAIDYRFDKDYVLDYDRDLEGMQTLKHAQYFKTDIVAVEDTSHSVERTDSFTILMVVEGNAVLECNGAFYELKTGESTLIPAACDTVNVTGTKAKMLEVYL